MLRDQGEVIARPGTDMYGYDLYGEVTLTLEECEDYCFSLPDCVAFVTRSSEDQCWP